MSRKRELSNLTHEKEHSRADSPFNRFKKSPVTAAMLYACLTMCECTSPIGLGKAPTGSTNLTVPYRGTATQTALNNKPGADTSVDALRAEAIYRELYLYDACGFAQEGSSERLKFRRFIMDCGLPADVKDEVLRFIDAPDNQHYGDHDQNVCSDEPAIENMVSFGAGTRKQTRLEILSRAALCTTARKHIASGKLAGMPALYDDYWQALNSMNKFGTMPAQGVK